MLAILPLFFCEAERTVVAMGAEIDQTLECFRSKSMEYLTLVAVQQTKEEIDIGQG